MAELLTASFQDWGGIQAGSQVGRLGVSLVERWGCGNWTYCGTEGPGVRWEPRPLGCGRSLSQDREGWQGSYMPAVPPLQPAGSSQHCLQRWVAGGEAIWSCIKNFTFFKVAERPFPAWALMALILLLKNNVTPPKIIIIMWPFHCSSSMEPEYRVNVGSPRTKSYIRNRDPGVLAEKEVVREMVHSQGNKGKSGIAPWVALMCPAV